MDRKLNYDYHIKLRLPYETASPENLDNKTCISKKITPKNRSDPASDQLPFPSIFKYFSVQINLKDKKTKLVEIIQENLNLNIIKNYVNKIGNDRLLRKAIHLIRCVNNIIMYK